MSANQQQLVDEMRANLRVLLVGPPGCAKTARVHEAALECGRRMVVQRVALLERPDFAGVMVPDTIKGVTRTLPMEVLFDLMTTQEDTLLFLDDFGQAPLDVQSATMHLFDPGVLSPHVLIWGATNRPTDVAGVTRLSEPIRSRFDSIYSIASQVEVAPGRWEPQPTDPTVSGEVLGTWEDEVAGWCDWGMDNDAPAEVIAWHRATNGRTLYQWKPSPNPAVRMPDFRTWESVIKKWNAGIRSASAMSSTLGSVVAQEFLAFARLADELPTPDQVWMDPMGAPVPDDKSALYLIATMLGETAKPQYADALVKYMRRMDRVYGALLARDLRKRLGAKLSGSKEWNRWFTENKQLFEVGTDAA